MLEMIENPVIAIDSLKNYLSQKDVLDWFKLSISELFPSREANLAEAW